MAIVFYIVFSAVAGLCVRQDVMYYVHRPLAPIEHKLEGKV